MRKITKKGQVWIETVIYTLIGITIIGILLAVSKPKIDSMRDKLVIEQTIESLNGIHDKIYDLQNNPPGNKRSVEIKVSKGRLIFDASSDKIIWTIDSKYQYSEIGNTINIGNQEVLTEEGDPYKVTLTMDYFGLADLTVDGSQSLKEISEAPSPYFIYIKNNGGSEGLNNIDVVVQ